MSAAALPVPVEVLSAVLTISLTAINLLRPCYAPDTGELVDFSLEYLNPAAQRMTGLAEQPGGTMRTHFADTFHNGVFPFYRRVFETQVADTYAFNYQADGLDNYFRLAAQRAGDYLVVSFTDTSDQDRSAVELALRASQAAEQAARADAEAQRQRFYEVLLQLPAQVATYHGPDHVYHFVNPRYQQYFATQTLLGRPFREVIPEVGAQGIFALLDRVYQTGESFFNPEVEAWIDFAGTGHPQQVFLNLSFYALRDGQGRIDGVLDFSYDVTESVRARRQVEQLNQELETRVQARTEELAALNEQLQARNEELNESNRQLTRTNVDLDTFVYTASHDLKAPITNIESILLALRETLPAAVQQDELISHLLTLLEQTTMHFQVTIGQLTDLSKLQLAHAGPAEPVPLAAVVESVCLDLASAITAANAQLTVDVASDLVVSFSPANLRSIVYNLLSNAVKYRALDRACVVQVRAEPGPDALVLTVQDNGLGMSELQQRQLFGMFQRLHTHVEGTGVGLYITKRLIENGGGTITVQSQPDGGTTFIVTFPA